MRKEIEVKARVDDLEKIARELQKEGCALSAPVVQDDTIFINFHGDYTKAKNKETNFLRLRQSGGTTLFTIKQPQSNELDCLEYESKVSDYEEMKRAIELLGYREVMRYVKTRRKTTYQGYEICLDEMTGLGAFVEAEKIVEDVDAEKVQEELFTMLERFGVSRGNRVTQGYDTLYYLAGKAHM